MLRLKEGQMTIWELMLPEELQNLPEELQAIDKILDDDRFFKPYLDRFNTKIGRPTVPVETYIRKLVTKFTRVTPRMKAYFQMHWKNMKKCARENLGEQPPTEALALNLMKTSVRKKELNEQAFQKEAS